VGRVARQRHGLGHGRGRDRGGQVQAEPARQGQHQRVLQRRLAGRGAVDRRVHQPFERGGARATLAPEVDGHLGGGRLFVHQAAVGAQLQPPRSVAAFLQIAARVAGLRITAGEQGDLGLLPRHRLARLDRGGAGEDRLRRAQVAERDERAHAQRRQRQVRAGAFGRVRPGLQHPAGEGGHGGAQGTLGQDGQDGAGQVRRSVAPQGVGQAGVTTRRGPQVERGEGLGLDLAGRLGRRLIRRLGEGG
jgi:hypothetical protein